jgi:hypothetical protein
MKRVVLEKLTVAYFVKNFPTLCGTWKFISPTLEAILSHLNRLHILTPYSFKTYF